MKQGFKVQVFATDIDSHSIATARVGRYPASIAADVTPERLARFFTADSDGSAYRINKALRDMLIFSEQSVIKDPPFSKLDLISCRNLMIYMGSELQKKLIPLFHYALNPNGYLFLGTSESIGEHGDLFAVFDRKAKVFQRTDNSHNLNRAAASRFLPPVTALEIAQPRIHGKAVFPVKLPLRELTEQALLKQIAPAGALVNGAGDILYLHGRTGRYLELTPGETGVSNILKMAREGLKHELTKALHNAVESREIVRCPGMRVKTNGDFSVVNLTIHPVLTGAGATAEAPLYLVVLEEEPAEAAGSSQRSESGGPPAEAGSPAADEDARIAKLQLELRAKEEYLQTANEELETSNEELKSSNEEMQSVNEELQSTNEELETSKEELQSVNEELATVNTELQTKVGDLSRVNNDMNNLLAGTGIGTVFVDHHLRILRFTPAITEIINLIPSDIGRPVGHIVSNLRDYDHLTADVKKVLDTLIPQMQDVQTAEGKWYTLRIMPYRTMDNVIEGAVITFVDVTEVIRVRESLKKANELLRLAVVVRDSRDAITVQDLVGRILAWNPAAERLYGWSEAEALAMNVRNRIPAPLQAEELDRVKQLSHAKILEPYLTKRLTKSGGVVDISMISTALVDPAGKMYAIATTERVQGG